VVPLEAVPVESARAEIAAARLARGQQVTHWDGRPIDELLDAEIRPHVCASTPQGNDLRAAQRLMAGAVGSRVTLRLASADGQARDVTLRRARYPVPSRRNASFEVRELAGGVVYVNLPSFDNEEIVKQFENELPRIKKARALILDVRSNGGGNSRHGWSIVSHLVDKATLTTAWRTRIYRPAHRAWGQAETWHLGKPDSIRPAKDPFLGPVAVLIGPATFSAAEDFVAVLHAKKRATLVGCPTGGSTGQPLSVPLPGGGGARVCCKRDTYPDGREFVGVGIQPDVVVDPLRQPEHEDPELARALEVVRAAADGK
jgi:C-terminal processing protease CtpA/Prc